MDKEAYKRYKTGWVDGAGNLNKYSEDEDYCKGYRDGYAARVSAFEIARGRYFTLRHKE